MSTPTIAPDDVTVVMPGITIDLLSYLESDKHEVIITGRYGRQSYTLSYHGTSPAEQHSNDAAIWGLTLVVDKQFGESLHSRAVTRHVALGKIIQVGEFTVFVDALRIVRVKRG